MNRVRKAAATLATVGMVVLNFSLGTGTAHAEQLAPNDEHPKVRLACGVGAHYNAINGSRNWAEFLYYDYEESGYRAGVWKAYDLKWTGKKGKELGIFAQGCNQ